MSAVNGNQPDPAYTPQPDEAPITTRVGADLYEALAPMAFADAAMGWALAIYLDVSGLAVEEVAFLVRADSEGNDGWSAFADPARCPDSFLRTLAQWAGIRWPGRMPLDYLRTLIGGKGSGLWRGTRSALIAEVRRFLPDRWQNALYFEERADGNPYLLRIFTYSFVDHDEAAVRAALEFAVPAGLMLDYEVRDGQTWGMLNESHTSWGDVRDSYTNWADAFNARPIGV